MRRKFRRGFRKGLGAGAGAHALRHANELQQQGDYNAAAQEFEQLASEAKARGGPHAPMLCIQAGRTMILAGQVSRGISYLKEGFEMLAAAGKWARLQRTGQRAQAELRQHGLDVEAKELLEFLRSRLPDGFDLGMAPSLRRRPILPTHCPSCGAIIEPDEVEWTDEVTAECDYCGSPIRVQE